MPGSVIRSGEVIVESVGAPDGIVGRARPKSRIFTTPPGRHHDVLGLQVAVDDGARVGRGEAVGDLDRDREERLQRQRAARQQLAQALPLDQLHDDVGGLVDLADLVDGDDVGVGDGGGGAGLLLEPLRGRAARGAARSETILMATFRPRRGSFAR